MNQEDLDGNNVTVTARKPIIIEEGKHKGQIGNVHYRPSDAYSYLDICIDLTDIESTDVVTIKYGVPLNLTEITKLGKLLLASGFKFKEETDYTVKEIRQALVGKYVTFQTTNEETSKGTFARILDNTIKFD